MAMVDLIRGFARMYHGDFPSVEYVRPMLVQTAIGLVQSGCILAWPGGLHNAEFLQMAESMDEEAVSQFQAVLAEVWSYLKMHADHALILSAPSQSL